MPTETKVAKKIFIRSVGYDEYWLQNLIYADPSILGLGSLIPVSKERKQSVGGRLDILLKDPEDDSMFEVEAMLGATDPSHIIRSVEYWDNEKRRYPQRQHFSVLVAESFDRRYFNVVQILSLNIPMLAIQVDLLDVGGQHILNFTKILDIYEEPEEDVGVEPVVNETNWSKNANWTLEAAKEFMKILSESEAGLSLSYLQGYIKIAKNGRSIYWLTRRAEPKSDLSFHEKDDEKVATIKEMLDRESTSYTYNKHKNFHFTVDKQFLSAHANLFKEIHKIRLVNSSDSDEIDEGQVRVVSTNSSNN